MMETTGYIMIEAFFVGSLLCAIGAIYVTIKEAE